MLPGDDTSRGGEILLVEKASLEVLLLLEESRKTRRNPGGVHRPNNDTPPVVSSHTAAQP